MSNVVFIAIMAYSIYGIGFELWNRTTGLLSSLFVLSMPMLVSQFKEYQLDAQLSAMAALDCAPWLRQVSF
jgi:4-amino-4-deoxy-L-arabinose transferase-like glycosyltransferase